MGISLQEVVSVGLGGFMSRRGPGRPRGSDQDKGVWVDFANTAEMATLLERHGSTGKAAMAASSLGDDEVSSRLFAAVVAIVEERRQLNGGLNEYKHLMEDAQRTIEELRDERQHALIMIEKKEDEIAGARRLVAEKQLKYDQLLDDYNQLRASDAQQYEQLQQQLKEMRLNYENLHSDYLRFRSESAKEAQRLEAEVRNGVVKYQQMVEETNKIREENANLMANIVNFTQQMAHFRPHDAGAKIPQAPPVAIRPTAASTESPVK